ncbi:DEAD/DEAH box helicase, partial [Actinomyces gerencseriae]|uniref:DEAD/DEAH box helicase n=1 Tax=Actinomyces gerencseriae TaxID=52769 RepID=UPI0023F55335
MTDRPARDLTELLTSIGARDGRLVHLQRTPARPGRHGQWPAWADPVLVTAYGRLGIGSPWTHQVAAADAVHSGRHTVLATGTGSGKSLAAWLPPLSGVLAAQDAGADGGLGVGATGRARISAHGRRPTALYLSPTKALAADQAVFLERLATEVESVQREAGLPAGSVRTVRTGACDGDTPLPERDWARAHADVVLTNPDFLHFSLLPGHERWTRLLRALRYIVVDECHAYRGILGAHVALVLRRLLRLVHRLRPDGPGPVVLCASATAAEPALTAARLIGVPPEAVTAVTDDGAPAGERTLALWQPALRDPWLFPESPATAPAPAADVPAPGPRSDRPDDTAANRDPGAGAGGRASGSGRRTAGTAARSDETGAPDATAPAGGIGPAPAGPVPVGPDTLDPTEDP